MFRYICSLFIAGLFLLTAANFLSAQNFNVLTTGEPPASEQDEQDENGNNVLAVAGGASTGSNIVDDVSASGLLGLSLYENDYSLIALFNYGGVKKIDVNNDYGSFLLNPLSSYSVLFSGNKNKIYKAMGGYVRAGIAWGEFKGTIVDENMQSVEKTKNGMVVHLSLGPQFLTSEFEPVRFPGNKYQFALEFGPAIRLLGSDLGSDKDFRKQAIGTDKWAFFGVELTGAVRLNNIRPYVRITYFHSDHDISGFNNIQGYLGVDILANMFATEI